MLENIGGNVFLVMAVLVFIAVLLLLEGGYLLWKSYKGPDAQKIETRIRAISASLDKSQQTQLLKQRMLNELPLLERFFLGISRAHRLDRFIQQSGLGWSVSKLMLSCFALGALGLLLMMYYLCRDAPRYFHGRIPRPRHDSPKTLRSIYRLCLRTWTPSPSLEWHVPWRDWVVLELFIAFFQ